MSRAISLVMAFFAGVRVAGQCTYIPAHTNTAGKKINARITIPVYANSHRGTNQKTGAKGRSDSFRLVAWGKLADTCARSLDKGKAMDVTCIPNSYLGKVYDENRQIRVDTTGQPIMVTKVGFTIKDIVFGEESAKRIAEQIAEYISSGGQKGRPQGWNIPNSPHYAAWLTTLQQRQLTTWNGQSNTFGFARVIVSAGVQLDFTAAPPAQTVAPGTPAVVAAVANAVGAAPVAPGIAAPPGVNLF